MSKFNSQVCTSAKQSQRLLKLGLKPETADMKHFFDNRDDYSFFHHWECFPYEWNEESLVDSENIPAWSLHRLLEMYVERYISCNVNLKELTFDWLIDEIGIHITENDFNKE